MNITDLKIAIEGFRNIVSPYLLNQLEIEDREIQNLEKVVYTLPKKDSEINVYFENLNYFLGQSNIRSKWNHDLNNNRSKFLSSWIIDKIDFSKSIHVIDVLCGDGKILNNLSNHFKFLKFSGCERFGLYNNVNTDYCKIISLDKYLELKDYENDTFILSTVLHHENEPFTFFEKILKNGRFKKAIVIENVISDKYNYQYNIFMDFFFNKALNNFDLECPGTHMTQEEWTTYFKKYGDIELIDSKFNVPGIPLEHTIFSINI